jgi:hypothetical protein
MPGIGCPMLQTKLLEFLLIPGFLILSPAFPVLRNPLPGCQKIWRWILLIPRTPLCSEPDTVLPVVCTLILLLLLLGSVENVELFSLSVAFGCDCHRIVSTFSAKADKKYMNCCRYYSSREERRVFSDISLFETSALCPSLLRNNA